MRINSRVLAVACALLVAASMLVLPRAARGAVAEEWSQVASRGIGDVSQAEISSLEVYGGDLYLGTHNDRTGCQVWSYDGSRWEQLEGEGFGYTTNRRVSSMAVFDSRLYVGTYNAMDGCEVLRYDGDGWESVVGQGEPGRPEGRGFGDENTWYVSSMTVYDGRLYAGTINIRAGCQVWRFDGREWEMACEEAFGEFNVDVPAMVVQGDSLFAGTTNTSDGCQVWRFDGVAWNKVADGGFGNEENTRVSSLAVLGGDVYAGTGNQGGCEVWRLRDGDWERCQSVGLGQPTNTGVMSMAVLGNELVIGTLNIEGGCQIWSFNGRDWRRVDAGDLGPDNLSAAAMAVYGADLYFGTCNLDGCQLWKYEGGTTRLILANGLGNTGNGAGASMTLYEGSLYVGTYNWDGCQVWRYDGAAWESLVGSGEAGTPSGPGFGDRRNLQVSTMVVFNGRLYAGTKREVGCQVWRYDGDTWEQVVGGGEEGTPTGPGFGDWGNESVESMAVYNETLYAGTRNDDGGELWMYRNDWRKASAHGEPLGPGLDNPDNIVIGAMVAHRDHIYMGTLNIHGCRVYRYNGGMLEEVVGQGEPGTVTGPGFGDPGQCWASTTTIHDDRLYVATTDARRCGIWEYNGDSWSPVNAGGLLEGERMVTTMSSHLGSLYVGTFGNNGVISDRDGWTRSSIEGFEERGNRGVSRMTVMDGCLYAGTFNEEGLEIWRLSGSSIASVNPASAGQGETLDVTVTGFQTSFTGGITRASFGSGITVNDSTVVDATHALANITVSWDAVPGPRDVNVITGDEVPSPLAGGFTVTAPPDPPDPPTSQPETSPTWYLAEGTSDWGFTTYVTLMNPNASEVEATVTYMTEEGPVGGPELDLPPSSQTVINPVATLGETDFSTLVECGEEKPIAVDRRMIWTGEGAASPDGHCSVGVTSPERTWYLAEGSSKWGFECWLLIANPNDTEATVTVTYMTEGEGPVPVVKTVPANSRRSYSMADDIGEADASIKVQADIPVIPERAMYRNNRREGHDSIGVTSPASEFYLAEGSTGWGFTTYVLIANPNGSEVEVDLTYMTEEGPVPHPENPITMPPDSRKTVRVNDFLPHADFSTLVTGSREIMAERAMYWDSGAGEACHASVGMSETHTSFYLPDGETYNGHETWTLVANPNDTDVTVEISYLTPGGTDNVTFTDTVPANSRRTYDMAGHIPRGRAAVMVTSKTDGKGIMAERAMYWNARGAGTDTIGGCGE